MKKMNVLVTGCSSFMKEIIDCLKINKSGYDVKVVGVDCNENNLLRVNVDHPFVVPRFTSDDYIPFMIDMCKEYDIDVILPYLTKELEVLSDNKHIFESIGVKVSVMDRETLDKVQDKVMLHTLFSEFMPNEIEIDDAEKLLSSMYSLGYPSKNVCCKIPQGCGGQGFAILNEEKANDITTFGRTGGKIYIDFPHLQNLVRKVDFPIILQEYIEGKDYSVCLLAENGNVISKVGYIGHTIVDGAIMSGEILKNDEAYQIAETITQALRLDGNVCLNFIVTDDKAYLLDVNPRLNATISFCCKAGVNLPLMRCQQLMSEEIDEVESIMYGLKMNKYYESEYFM